MRLLILPLAIVLSFSATAREKTDTIYPRYITSSHEIFFGEGAPTEPCTSDARLLNTLDINRIGQETLCKDVTSPYAIWKVAAQDGTEWSFMGYGYGCESKGGVNPWAQALCVMNETPPQGKAYIYPNVNFQGEKPWSGRAEIKTGPYEAPEAVIQSFSLGEGVKLIAFSEKNYGGDEKTYTKTTAYLESNAASYRIEAIAKANDVSFSYKSLPFYKSCLTLFASDSDIGEVEICSDSPLGAKVFTVMPDKGMTNFVVVTFNTYEEGKPSVTENGTFAMKYAGTGTFTIEQEVLPRGLSIINTGAKLEFIYQFSSYNISVHDSKLVNK